MPWARASQLHRHLHCPAASYLPRWDDVSNKEVPGYLGLFSGDGIAVLTPSMLEPRDKRAAVAGTEAHAQKERGELAPELWEGTDPEGEHEVSFAYDCRTGKVDSYHSPDQREREEWKAQCGTDCVTGTCDWWGALNGHNWIDDLKTGYGTPRVNTPAMLFYAMCANELSFPRTSVLLSVTHWPRCRGEPHREGLWYTAQLPELELFRWELHDAWRVTTRDRDPRPGDHCTWCPSAAWCPEARG